MTDDRKQMMSFTHQHTLTMFLSFSLMLLLFSTLVLASLIFPQSGTIQMR